MVQCFQEKFLKTSTWLTVLYAQNFAITERQLYSNSSGVFHLTHYDQGKVSCTSFTNQTSSFQYVSLTKVAEDRLVMFSVLKSKYIL